MSSVQQQVSVVVTRHSNLFENAAVPLPVASVHVGVEPRVVSAGGFVGPEYVGVEMLET